MSYRADQRVAGSPSRVKSDPQLPVRQAPYSVNASDVGSTTALGWVSFSLRFSWIRAASIQYGMISRFA